MFYYIFEGPYLTTPSRASTGWPGGARRPANWTIDAYVAQWAQYAQAVQVAIGTSKPFFQGCAFEAPRYLGSNETPFWNVENAEVFGMNKTLALSVADHDVSDCLVGW